jgi:ATP-binding cassette subfamily B protein
MSSEFVARQTYRSDHTGPARFVWSHVRRHPVVGLGMILGAFSNAALASAVPYFAGRAVEGVIDSNNLALVLQMALAIAASQFIRGGLQLLRNFSSETFAQRVERDVRDELYASLLGKSMTFHDLQPVGEIMARVTNDVREMNYMMNPGLNLIIGSGMFLVVPLVVAPSIYPALLITPLAFFILYVISQMRYVVRLHRVAQEVRASFGEMNARLAETLDGIQIVKGSSQERQEISVFHGLVDEVTERYIRQGDTEARYTAALLLGLATVGGFMHSLILYRAGAIQAGDIVAFMGQIALFGFPVFSSLFALSHVALGYASAERILNIIHARTDLDQNEDGHSGIMSGEIAFEDVCFGYMEGKEVVKNASFRVFAGKTVAFVGQTGSGKSTLTKLINRTYDASEGRVMVDGVDVRDWNLAALRSQISIIEQEVFLFSRSIADNIRFGRPDASQQEVEEAAHKAQAHDFISKMPEGYETIIGQRGVTLSGGQRQRLAIARAFLTNPRILILDDSTSAIDSATEDHIQKAIWTAAEGRTTILITHRLSQIRWADHIVVIRKGEVVAQGTHDQLLETSDAYRRIFARYESKTLFQDAATIRKLLDTPTPDAGE